MRDLHLLDTFRLVQAEKEIYKCRGNSGNGVFVVRSPIDNGELMIIASNGGGWDHVSVSRNNRCPNWPEMAHVKELFFTANETVMQLHVPELDHINRHPFCLHLWRPQGKLIPRPPAWMLDIKSGGEAA